MMRKIMSVILLLSGFSGIITFVESQNISDLVLAVAFIIIAVVIFVQENKKDKSNTNLSTPPPKKSSKKR